MEVDVMLGGNGYAVERGWLVAPLPERRHDLFVDPMPDGLQDAGFDDSALRVDGHFDNDVALQIPGKFRSCNRRVGIHDGISHVHFMASDRPVDHGAEGRARAGIVLGGFGVHGNRLMAGGWLWR